MNVKTTLISLLFWCFSCPIITAQFFDIGVSIGGATYQGDISPLGNRLSFEGARIMKSMHIGYSFNDFYAVKLRYSSTTINGNDASSLDIWRRQRNLHFGSPITEWALINEIELFDILTFFRKYNLKPYINFGVAVFKFNPQAKYRGNWVDLQPLTTEGQGLPGSTLSPYNLTQISIPFGFGLKYHVTDALILSFEISPRITFTDYLDDVSAT